MSIRVSNISKRKLFPTRHCNAKPVMEEFISEEPKCDESYYDQSAFYNCTEWVFSAADNMDGDIAFSLELCY